MNLNFRTLDTFLKPSTMGMLVDEYEPNEKKCFVHAPSIHGGAFTGVDSFYW
jgi:hypothetical protein